MANLPSSSSPVPSTDANTSNPSKPAPPAITTATPNSEDVSTSDIKKAESNIEPDTAVATADSNGNSNSGHSASSVSNTPLKPITVPLSPPIPTPPFNESFDTSATGQRAMSNLTLESPEATSKPIEVPGTIPAVAGDSSVSNQPITATPAVVQQPTSGIREAPKSSESPEVDMKDVTPTPTTEAPPKLDGESKPKATATVAATTAGQDAEMPDAPAHTSSPPTSSLMSSSLVRARSESAEPERPNKRQKTAEPESLPDAAAPEHAAKANGSPPSKAEVASPTAMDTTADQPGPSKASVFTGDPMPIHQTKFALSNLKNIKRLKDAQAFLNPVDPVKLQLPTYFEIIKNPMSLFDIEKKLTANEYHNPAELKGDVHLMVQNSILFNGVEHAVTQSGIHIRDKYLHALEKMPPAEIISKSKPQPKRPVVSTAAATVAAPAAAPPSVPSPVVNTPDSRVRRESARASVPTSAMSPTAASPTFSLTPGGVPQIRRDSIVTADGRPKRPIHAPPPKDLPYSDLKPRRKKSVAEFKFCETIMKELWKKQHNSIAYPFYNPVDPVALEIPDYFKIIKKPMDMSEIQRKLNHNEYNNSNEFEADIRLMFNNCYKFNPPSSPVYDCGKQLEAVFDEKWSQKPSFKEETPTPPVVAEEEEGEDSDDEDSDEDAAPALEMLKAQLGAIHSQIETIEKKKKSKKSPPATSKKHKKSSSTGAAVVKPTPKTTPLNKKKGSSSKKKEPPVPYMTFAQKTELSERINQLSPHKMQQVLSLIKTYHPDLAEGDEIELDIDELAPATVHKLYIFVTENTLPPAESAAPVAPAPKMPKAVPTKQRKKNKPMSATEQERKIREIQSQIEGFEGGSPTDDGPRSLASMGAKQVESSSDDDPSSGSESEEE
ncbi:hypothetical protein AOL_s00081g352 [Orbilia oligospora ATCC 24927]|uniref:Bromodomain-containing protein n=2 Tax=Orbilia oligospora TaxID=2813651 RepID=G1XG59_ARTOA|nr:hypothetical protein AOL_s00081g352 [Orbilia oligospora ATCC 24927]EGX48025.1 hypothetical protein AOL_s00081g352 [Orbilia oligospora ATCC 24927]KAF3274452.1 hypothetical protein TWF970_007966 [Orbilia oligospora]KAF3274453.1 hypothetical protein TWF970_007966 [Orbilia oligospora]